MTKRVMLVYQDCVDCKGREGWYQAQEETAKQNGLIIVPTPYFAVKDIILAAQEKGLTNTLIFYTDGKQYGYDIKDFIPKQKQAKADKEPKDGVD